MLSVRPGARPSPAWREQVARAVADVQTVFVDAREAVVEARRKDPGIDLDGMGIAVWLRTAEGSEEFAGHAARPMATQFAQGLIQLAWTSCHDAHVRNALASCGWYLGL
jgi:hypothetical protein